jgi:hypothetical protein
MVVALTLLMELQNISWQYHKLPFKPVAYPGIFSGGGSTNSVEDKGQRERGSGGGSPLVRGSGGNYNLVQEISFHIVKCSNFWYVKTTYFGSASSKLRNFGGEGLNRPNPLPRYATESGNCFQKLGIQTTIRNSAWDRHNIMTNVTLPRSICSLQYKRRELIYIPQVLHSTKPKK